MATNSGDARMNNLAPAPSRGLLLEIYLLLSEKPNISRAPWYIAMVVLHANTQTDANPCPDVKVSRNYHAHVVRALYNGTAFGYFVNERIKDLTYYRIATDYEYQLKKDQRTQDASKARSEKYLNEKRSWWRRLIDRVTNNN